MTSRARRLGTLAALALTAAPAEAHHMIDGRLPETLREGLLSGAAHPVIGVDHLLALVALALLARGPHAPIAFVIASLAGVAPPAFGFVSLASETMVALSVAALGVLLFFGLRRDDAPAIAAAAAIGALHGFAYAEAIVGAEPTPLAAYLLGLGLVELAIVGALGWVARRAASSWSLAPAWTSRAPGAAITAAGVALLFAGPL